MWSGTLLVELRGRRLNVLPNDPAAFVAILRAAWTRLDAREWSFIDSHGLAALPDVKSKCLFDTACAALAPEQPSTNTVFYRRHALSLALKQKQRISSINGVIVRRRLRILILVIFTGKNKKRKYCINPAFKQPVKYGANVYADELHPARSPEGRHRMSLDAFQKQNPFPTEFHPCLDTFLLSWSSRVKS